MFKNIELCTVLHWHARKKNTDMHGTAAWLTRDRSVYAVTYHAKLQPLLQNEGRKTTVSDIKTLLDLKVVLLRFLYCTLDLTGCAFALYSTIAVTVIHGCFNYQGARNYITIWNGKQTHGITVIRVIWHYLNITFAR